MRGKLNVDLCSRFLNYISLCTGGGGLDLGVDLAIPGARAVCLVEREAFAVAHLVAAMQASLMAPAPVWSDVGTFAGRPWRGLVDGLVGGIPCQPHSLAGKRLGEEDERDLWSDARRIIVQCGAWFVLIENVEGMLSSGGAERVVRDLRRLGFEVEVGLFSASEAGASHQRNRVFILAVADTGSQQWRARWTGRGGTIGGRSHPQSAGSGFELADAGRERNERRGGAGDVLRTAGEGQGEGHQRQRDGNAAGDGPEALADAISQGREGSQRPGASAERYGPTSPRSIAELRGVPLEDAEGGDRSLHERSRKPGERARNAGRTSAVVGDALGSGHDGRADDAIGGSIGGAITKGASGDGVASLFPPGPSDLDGWRRVLEDSPHLEPAVRRMADGVAARMDLSGPHVARIERLRMLGNGVVPLQAAYAIRTLGARLAANGSAGAAFLVQLMKIKN